eukprot:CAMPEP_0181463434 /NCGR_PEP_ID=MMETSP1110-20121109/34912_1 /TAXON_ID=174948 /ORGANISM="Symbiodinium sp., Strain CCMP421" /LENGTH=138 /DNA_ID=CAMNT_0023588131 /DNA_START=61 /DNA_END=475 /DNA_ORIENTATION=+
MGDAEPDGKKKPRDRSKSSESGTPDWLRERRKKAARGELKEDRGMIGGGKGGDFGDKGGKGGGKEPGQVTGNVRHVGPTTSREGQSASSAARRSLQKVVEDAVTPAPDRAGGVKRLQLFLISAEGPRSEPCNHFATAA